MDIVLTLWWRRFEQMTRMCPCKSHNVRFIVDQKGFIPTAVGVYVACENDVEVQ